MRIAVLTLTRDRLERFWAKVDERGPNDCWPWTASKRGNGYGQFNWNGKPIVASRLALMMKLGRELREGYYALHSCDNPSCVNPKHLYEGTLSDNTQDALRRGRHRTGRGRSLNVGSYNGNAKLVEDDVRAIRASEDSVWQLAQRYGVSTGSIKLILAGRTWRHVS